MKLGKMKKVMAAVCAATMLMSATLMVCAEEPTASGNSTSSGTSTSTSTDTSSSTSTVVSVEPALSFVEKMAKTTNESISVAGVETRTSVAGVYAAQNVRGAVVETPAADVKAALGLTWAQKPTIFVYDVDTKKSVNAMASINAAAEALESNVVACLQVELGAKENGKWVELSDGSIALKAGLPRLADTSLTYYVICVQEGGVITVLEDLDTDPDTVTFAVNVGLGAYAIVAK